VKPRGRDQRECGKSGDFVANELRVSIYLLIRYVHETSGKSAAAEIATNKHYLGLGDMKHAVNPTSHHVDEPQYVMISWGQFPQTDGYRHRRWRLDI